MADGVEPTRLVLGCAQLGGLYVRLDDDEAAAVVDEAWRLGVRAFDTAPYYGYGLSERRLGDALRRRPRDEYVLSTKVGRLLVPRVGAQEGEFPGAPPLSPVKDYTRDGVLTSLGASLGRLGLDRIDVVHVHDPDEPAEVETAIREALPTLVELREQGVIGAVSAGMNEAAPLARMVREADMDVVLLAGRYTLLEQRSAEELLGLCLERGVPVLAAGVFNSGVLADPHAGAPYDYAPASTEIVDRARAVAAICARHDVPVVAAAEAFPLRHPAVAGIVVGAESAAQVRHNVECLARDVPEALWDDLAAAGLIATAAP